MQSRPHTKMHAIGARTGSRHQRGVPAAAGPNQRGGGRGCAGQLRGVGTKQTRTAAAPRPPRQAPLRALAPWRPGGGRRAPGSASIPASA